LHDKQSLAGERAAAVESPKGPFVSKRSNRNLHHRQCITKRQFPTLIPGNQRSEFLPLLYPVELRLPCGPAGFEPATHGLTM